MVANGKDRPRLDDRVALLDLLTLCLNAILLPKTSVISLLAPASILPTVALATAFVWRRPRANCFQRLTLTAGLFLILVSVAVLTLPGYFRRTKLWDVLVMHDKRLVAAIELKSQVGPSFGNNFNNRTEEAIGTAHDLWTAYREGAFGKHPRPFIGWMMMVEDAPESRRPVTDRSPHFPLFKEFQGASYLKTLRRSLPAARSGAAVRIRSRRLLRS